MTEVVLSGEVLFPGPFHLPRPPLLCRLSTGV
jgi:hypothetical protein